MYFLYCFIASKMLTPGPAENFVYLLNKKMDEDKISSAAPALGLLHWQ